ncbi:hypothetical protein GC102_36365 [Paenibacillus sp. LMG 31460]|uniref:Uncharacterized protein n=1 Tax=Paenibacillus germinis TaxID=2654979 RepID=A0ABX1ZGN7_9BACL|nr:hypothetical protein [Paenibacillus germinis]NOU91163.1 hypothetical protein [Paenibacillus germinis]
MENNFPLSSANELLKSSGGFLMKLYKANKYLTMWQFINTDFSELARNIPVENKALFDHFVEHIDGLIKDQVFKREDKLAYSDEMGILCD